MAWHIEAGTIDDIDVSGLTAVSISTHSGHRADAIRNARMMVRLFVDDVASDKQEAAVERAFTGALGGPLAELAQMTNTAAGIERAAITFASASKLTLRVGDRVEASMTPLVGATDTAIMVSDSVMARVLGPVGEFGTADHFRLDLPSLALTVEGSSATRGHFAYRSQR
jgi:hypothetical protein